MNYLKNRCLSADISETTPIAGDPMDSSRLEDLSNWVDINVRCSTEVERQVADLHLKAELAKVMIETANNINDSMGEDRGILGEFVDIAVNSRIDSVSTEAEEMITRNVMNDCIKVHYDGYGVLKSDIGPTTKLEDINVDNILREVDQTMGKEKEEAERGVKNDHQSKIDK